MSFFGKPLHYARFVRLRPFDITTQEGMAAERYRMAAWASLVNFASTGLGMLALIITVPMTLPYLGPERFGIWMTVASFAGLLSFMDLGVGNGLINRIASVNARRAGH